MLSLNITEQKNILELNEIIISYVIFMYIVAASLQNCSDLSRHLPQERLMRNEMRISTIGAYMHDQFFGERLVEFGYF